MSLIGDALSSAASASTNTCTPAKACALNCGGSLLGLVGIAEGAVDLALGLVAVGLRDQDAVALGLANGEDVGGVEAVAADDQPGVAQVAQLLHQVAAVGREARDDHEVGGGAEHG